MDEKLFAYSLSQVDEGWTWSLWDEDGDVVAAGAAPDQSSARHCLFEAIEETRGGGEDRTEGRHEPAQRRPLLDNRPGRRRERPASSPSRLALAPMQHPQGR